MVAGLEQRKTHQQDGRHAAGRGNRRLRALHRRQPLLEARHRGIGRAGIGVALFLAGKAPRCGGGVGLDEAAAQVQRFRMLAKLAARYCLAHRQGVGVQTGAIECRHEALSFIAGML